MAGEKGGTPLRMPEAAARSRPSELLRGRTGGCRPQTQRPPLLLRTGVPHGSSRGRGASRAVKLRRGHPPRGLHGGERQGGKGSCAPRAGIGDRGGSPRCPRGGTETGRGGRPGRVPTAPPGGRAWNRPGLGGTGTGAGMGTGASPGRGPGREGSLGAIPADGDPMGSGSLGVDPGGGESRGRGIPWEGRSRGSEMPGEGDPGGRRSPGKGDPGGGDPRD